MPMRSSESNSQSAVSTLFRRSPRFLELNNRRLQFPATPIPRSGNNDQVSNRSSTRLRSSSLRRSHTKNQNDIPAKSSKKLVADSCRPSRNDEISVKRTRRSTCPVEGILGLRRSPRFHSRENDDKKTCAYESNRSIDCRTPRLKRTVGGIQGLGHCPRLSNPVISHETFSHENKGSIDGKSNGYVSLSDIGRTNRRLRRSSVAFPPTLMERGERKSGHSNGGRVKEIDGSEIKVNRVIVDALAADKKIVVTGKKDEGNVPQAGGHSSNHPERRPKQKKAHAALVAGGGEEVLRERANDDRKQGKSHSSKHPESRSAKARRKSLAVTPDGGGIEIEWSDGKENKCSNASGSEVEPGKGGKRYNLRVKENDDSEMTLKGVNVVALAAKEENAVLRKKDEGDVQQAGCHLSNPLKCGPKQMNKATVFAAPDARVQKESLRDREKDNKKKVGDDSSKRPKNILTRARRRKCPSVRSGGAIDLESSDRKENKGGNASTSSDVEPGQGVSKDNLRKFSTGTRAIGVKRKRKQVVAIQKTEQGWTLEQEMALQRAYFTAKPTPQFWKKVAKRVPGKSAQDCFDKVHSDNLTPPSSRTRSRAKGRNLSPPSRLSFSTCKLLKSPEENSKKACKYKQKSHIVHRNVRHMLEKYCQVGKDDRPDLFSVLEPTADESALFTPGPLLGSLGFSPVSCQRSSSGQKKRLSSFNNHSATALTSPPVLKQVKNVALHEKYIDQLHIREAKRKAASKHNVKCISIAENKKGSPVQNKDVIKAARNALVSDACDAISKFKNLQQINLMDEFSDREEYFNDEDLEDDAL